jgi:hypothetical protein
VQKRLTTDGIIPEGKRIGNLRARAHEEFSGGDTNCCMFPFPQVARRCWSGNPKAYEIICQTMQDNDGLVVTLPHEVAEEHLLQQALRS